MSSNPFDPKGGPAICRTEDSLILPRVSQRGGLRAAGARRAVIPFGEPAGAEARATTPPQVRLSYLVPADVLPRNDYRRAINNAGIHLQRFYAEQLGGRSFLLRDPAVEVLRTGHDADFYSTNPAGSVQNHWFFNNVTRDGLALTGGQFFDPQFVWIFYIDAPHDPATGGGAGTSGVAALPREDLDGLLGTFDNACRWVGGLGHELGHALGLPHPPGCDSNPSGPDCNSLMFLGYPNYPDTFFSDLDRARLSDNRFIQPVDLTGPVFDCATGL